MKPKRQKPLITVILLDILAAAIILCSYAGVHHVIPTMRNRKAALEAMARQAETAAVSTPEPTPSPEPSAQPADESLPGEEIEEPEVIDTRTEWQKKFEDKFTSEVIRTENSYSSPNVSVTVDRVERTLEEYGYGSWPVVYYVADIYVGSLECFRTYTANNRLDASMKQSMAEMDAASNSIVSVNGDFFCYYSDGFYIRNGETYLDNSIYGSICVLFNDGTMETYNACEYDIQELEERGIWQVWSFGPPLLDSEGHAIGSARSTTPTVNQQNPRCVAGYYEPGHYCLVVVDGRSDASKGMILWMLADLMEELGCKCAYNLDGGGSAMMYFDHELISIPSNNDRALSDILCVVDTEDIVPGPNR